MSSLDELRRRIAEEWDNLDMDIVSAAIDFWFRKIRCRIWKRGGRFEYKYYHDVCVCFYFRLIYNGKPTYRAHENYALFNLSHFCAATLYVAQTQYVA